jgi:molybdopterin-guanine dinucleotide biosynthesis protein A
MSKATLIGAVLTGGRSSRMGRPKAEVEVGGHPMGSLVASAVGSSITTVVAAGIHPIQGIPRLDDGGGVGPIAALTGLALAWEALDDPDGVFVTAVDHAWIDAGTITRLTERFASRAVVPMHRARQVLCAVYPRSFIAGLTSETTSIQAALDVTDIDEVGEAEWRSWGEDGRSWFSADRLEDLEIGLARFGPPREAQ